MDDLREQIELLESSANLSTSIEDVQKAIDMLTAARERIAAGLSAHRVPASTGTDHCDRSRKGAVDSRKATGALQENDGIGAERSEAYLFWAEQVRQSTGQGRTCLYWFCSRTLLTATSEVQRQTPPQRRERCIIFTSIPDQPSHSHALTTRRTVRCSFYLRRGSTSTPTASRAYTEHAKPFFSNRLVGAGPCRRDVQLGESAAAVCRHVSHPARAAQREESRASNTVGTRKE